MFAVLLFTKVRNGLCWHVSILLGALSLLVMIEFRLGQCIHSAAVPEVTALSADPIVVQVKKPLFVDDADE